jgi:uncharacterized membrane protein YeaQ/YmgE (transglycosylase-associated protein family)
MGWILTVAVGGILGWLASEVMRTGAQQGIILNIVVGVVGAALAGFFLSPLLGIATINAANFSFGGLLISFHGALTLLAIVNLIGRGRPVDREPDRLAIRALGNRRELLHLDGNSISGPIPAHGGWDFVEQTEERGCGADIQAESPYRDRGTDPVGRGNSCCPEGI